MNQIGTALVSSCDYRLVTVSILIAILASYVALDLAARVTTARGGARRAWLTGDRSLWPGDLVDALHWDARL
jgi:NO-binding membrane sensor protein with MHYT domain